MRRGIATFTLDTGQCPKWLFERMVRLGREMARVLIEEYGSDEFIRRISDPVWFQSLGTVLAFDWNSSGITTLLTAALKEAIRGEERNFGVFICGGKGKTSRKTPEEIQRWGEWIGLPEAGTQNLVYNSKMSAKVDSALVQDGFQLYHHSFFFSRNGVCPHTYVAQFSVAVSPESERSFPLQKKVCSKCGHEEGKPQRNIGVGAWSVVQQGMNASEGTARRYHWHSENINDLVCEPHTGISSQSIGENVLNMVAEKSTDTRNRSTELVQSGYKPLMKEIQILRKYSSHLSQMIAMKNNGGEQLTLLNLEDIEFHSHPVITEDFSKSKYLEKILARVTDEKPENYEKLIAMQGVGPKTVRALALVAEVIFGAKPSYEDPARYSFAHGGKDATPYPVDRKTYDKTIEMLLKAVQRAKISPVEKEKVVRRLAPQKARYDAIDPPTYFSL